MRFKYLLPFCLAVAMTAQTPTPAPARPPGIVRPSAYPQRPPADPAAVARGKATFGVHCSFCHGSDARGGEGGPNLIRSELVLNDKDGEKIAPVVQNGRPDRGMPKFDLSAASISDIATYIHSFKVGGYDISRQQPVSILVGDAKAGETYFNAKCASCHSVTGDLKGLGAKFADPKVLQQTWLAPGGAGRRGPAAQASAVPMKPVTVTVTSPSGEKTEGRLIRIDDFIVTLINADGTQSSFRRDGDSPKVEVHDPSQPHRDLLATYTDKDIHNLTAYLVTLK
jgi:cytochrome c oxidase cbb3-type subunit 3